MLLCGREQVRTLLEGGTGSLSIQQDMPDFLPDRLEAGTHNMPGIAGLLEGVRFVRRRGEKNICERERRLTMLAAESIRTLKGVKVFALPDLRAQAGVLSFASLKMNAETVAERLGEYGIAVRAGLHCAPLAHESAGTSGGGTVRLSFSDFNTPGEVYHFLAELRSCLRE